MTDDLTRPGDVQLAQASGAAIPNQDVVVVTQPPNGGEIVLPSPADRVYDLRFDPRLVKVHVIDADGDGNLDLVLRFNGDLQGTGDRASERAGHAPDHCPCGARTWLSQCGIYVQRSRDLG